MQLQLLYKYSILFFWYSGCLQLYIRNLDNPPATRRLTQQVKSTHIATGNRYRYREAFMSYFSFLPTALNIVVDAESTRFVG